MNLSNPVLIVALLVLAALLFLAYLKVRKDHENREKNDVSTVTPVTNVPTEVLPPPTVAPTTRFVDDEVESGPTVVNPGASDPVVTNKP